jgi:hypothetical protein
LFYSSPQLPRNAISPRGWSIDLKRLFHRIFCIALVMSVVVIGCLFVIAFLILFYSNVMDSSKQPPEYNCFPLHVHLYMYIILYKFKLSYTYLYSIPPTYCNLIRIL